MRIKAGMTDLVQDLVLHGNANVTFADLPGLISKHWLSDKNNNTYGGVYFWESHEAMQNYLESDVFSEIANNPSFSNTTSKDFAILEGPTKTTRGNN